MNFQTSIKTCFNKFAVFSGRASRSEFWFFVLFGCLGGIITVIIDVMILGYPYEENGPISIEGGVVSSTDTVLVSDEVFPELSVAV